MESDLTALEQKVAQLIELCQRLRTENIDLRQALAQSQNDIKQLKDDMALAGDRLQALIASLPEDTDE